MRLTTTRNLVYFLERAASHADATSGGNDGRRLRTGNSLPVCHLKILYELYMVLVHAVLPGLNVVVNVVTQVHA